MQENQLREREERIQALGTQLLQCARTISAAHAITEKWVESVLRRLNAEPSLRVQVLRFVDVLPSLANDADLIRLFDEYFHEISFPLPHLGDLALRAGHLLGDNVRAKAIRQAALTLSQRFLAGQNAKEVFQRSDQILKMGRTVSVDRVGEVTLTEPEAEQYLQSYLDLIAASKNRHQEPLHLSLKLSSLYSRIAPHNIERASEVILQRLIKLASAARDAGAAITIDMEDFDKRALTLKVFERLVTHADFGDWPDVGIAQQAYLKGVLDDLEKLVELAKRRGTPFHVRLVRGAYWDQECVRSEQNGWSVPVWQRQEDTDRSYEAGIHLLLSAYPYIRANIATHNPRSMACAMAVAEERGLEKQNVEFQMLYGMAEPLQQAVVDAGYPMRVYLPFGDPIPGMAYLVRRLLENSSSQSLARLAVDTHSNDEALLTPPVVENAEISPPTFHFKNEPPHRFVNFDERERFADAISKVRSQLNKDWPLLVVGQYQSTTEVIESYCPAEPDLLVGRVARANRRLVDDAIIVAKRVWPAWRDRPAKERCAILRSAANKLRQQRDEFAAWMIFEAGKNWPEADADVCEAIDFLNYYADEAERLDKERGLSLPGESNRYFYQGRGLGVVIPPWNFPLAILTGMLSATLVSGNCAILKPSSDTPVIAAKFIQLLVDAGVPAGVLAFLPGAGEEVGEYLVDHPATHIIAFTGSRHVGCRLLERSAKLAAGQVHVKKVIAEMGGKNAVIVDSSADLDEAVSGILQSAFGFQGQKCSACSRVIAVANVYEALVNRLVEAVDGLMMAMPWEAHCDIGPVINEKSKLRIEKAIEDGKQWGELVYEAAVYEGINGHFVGPVIFKDVDPQSPLAREEIFGPVLSVIPAKDFDKAIEIASNTDYALTGGVYSRSPANLDKAAAQFRVGNLYLNRGITGALVARQPFGGFKLSGVGSKAGGPHYLLQFMEPRCITENTMRRGVAPGAS